MYCLAISVFLKILSVVFYSFSYANKRLFSSLSDSLLLVCGDASDFCMLVLKHVTLLLCLSVLTDF